MKFSEIVDDNGNTLQSLAELLQEKAKAAGLVSILVFAAQDGPHKGIHAMSSIAGSVSTALIRLGEEMREEPTQKTPIRPVSADKLN